MKQNSCADLNNSPEGQPWRSAEKAGMRSCLQVPLWLLVGLLSVVFLVAVGVLTYSLVYTRTGEAMDTVAVSYRELGFSAVENKVVGMLGQVAAMTKLLGLVATTVTNGSTIPLQLRRQLSLGLSVMSMAQDHYLGFSTGELLVLHRLTAAADSAEVWEVSSNLTGNRIAIFPATSWDTDWLAPA
eukprot:RCo034364